MRLTDLRLWKQGISNVLKKSRNLSLTQMSWALTDKKEIYQTETLGKGRGNTMYKELKGQQCTNHSWAGKGLCSHTGRPTLGGSTWMDHRCAGTLLPSALQSSRSPERPEALIVGQQPFLISIPYVTGHEKG